MRRMRGAGTVLLIQDGTDLDVASHHGCHGLGMIARKGRKGSGILGIHMHSTFALSEQGIPLWSGFRALRSSVPKAAASIGSRRGAPHAAKRLSTGARRGAPPSNCAG